LLLVDTYGLDQVRFVMLREVPFGGDGDFSRSAVVNRVNGELANEFGNLAQRVLTMVARNCEARVPAAGESTAEDEALLATCSRLLPAMREAIDVQAFHEAIDRMWALVRAGNAYVDRQAPWVLRKTDPVRMAAVLYVLCETLRHLAILAQPLMPDAAARMLDQLAVGPAERSFAHLGPEHALTAGTPLPPPAPVFPRYAEAEADEADK
jgi:methionyl-tRNA synthetase